MKCPHCNAPLTEEQVFCEVCGKERELVPVFDAKIADVMDDTISKIAVDLANTQEIPVIKPERIIETETPKGESESSEDEQIQIKTDKNGTRFLIFIMAAVAMVVFLVIGMIVWFNAREKSSYDYKIAQAEEMYNLKDYEQTLSFAMQAEDIVPDSSEAKMWMAKAYEGMGKMLNEKQILGELLANDPTCEAAYDMLIPLYEEAKEYDKIAKVLSGCELQTVLDSYAHFLASPPQLSETPGNYEEAIALKLIAPGTGKIYYTLDGSDPAEKKKEYMTPILMYSGRYSIKAIYVNEYQVESAVIQAEFYIDEAVTPAPLISPEPGSYTEPQYLTVDIPDESYEVYYTTDGSEPGMESSLYEGAIPIPSGESQFAFVMYDASGVPGEIAYVQYQMNLDLAFTGEQAVNMLLQSLISHGVITDADGHLENREGKKQYIAQAVIAENDQYYYMINEIYISPQGDSQATGERYAVSVTTGESFRAVRNFLGTFDLKRLP